MELKVVTIEKPEEINFIFGQSHFIKTVEDIHEALVGAVPGIQFGMAFCESSGARLIRHTGTDEEMEALAIKNAKAIAAGHTFIIFLKNAFPVNVLKQIQHVPEVVTIFAASANLTQVVIAETEVGRGVLGVIDGGVPQGVEQEDGIAWRTSFLRQIGYKLS